MSPLMLPGRSPDFRLLDYACGPGTITRAAFTTAVEVYNALGAAADAAAPPVLGNDDAPGDAMDAGAEILPDSV